MVDKFNFVVQQGENDNDNNSFLFLNSENNKEYIRDCRPDQKIANATVRETEKNGKKILK